MKNKLLSIMLMKCIKQDTENTILISIINIIKLNAQIKYEFQISILEY